MVEPRKLIVVCCCSLWFVFVYCAHFLLLRCPLLLFKVAKMTTAFFHRDPFPVHGHLEGRQGEHLFRHLRPGCRQEQRPLQMLGVCSGDFKIMKLQTFDLKFLN